MRRWNLAIAVVALVFSASSHAYFLSVSGQGSIIPAPPAALEDDITNTEQSGFNEVQNYTVGLGDNIKVSTTGYPAGATLFDILVGTQINSHMIFFNTQGNDFAATDATWEFDADIIGVMWNKNGSLEVATSGILGAPGTAYPGAAFNARGLEGGDIVTWTGSTLDFHSEVTEPGDWIRVITKVPEPGVLVLLGAGLLGMAGVTRRRKSRKL